MDALQTAVINLKIEIFIFIWLNHLSLTESLFSNWAPVSYIEQGNSTVRPLAYVRFYYIQIICKVVD